MSNSSLVTKFIPAYAGNYTKNRAAYGKISEITVHHTAGNTSIDALGRLWQRAGRNGSSHYGVQHGQIGQYVDEADVAWTNSNWAANCRAVTIETANSGGAPNWPVADDTLETLIKLVADIAKRNGLVPLVYGKSLTWHSMYAATACPGPYLAGKLQYIVDRANEINSGAAASTEETPPAPGSGTASADGLYRVQVGAFKSKTNASNYAATVKKAGFDSIITTQNGLYRVQLGAFKNKTNAEAYAKTVRSAGYEAVVVGGSASGATANTTTGTIKVGSTVRLNNGAKTYTGGALAPFVYNRNHMVTEVSGSRAVISYNGTVVAAVNVADLTLV